MGCLFGGALVRNVEDAMNKPLRTEEIDIISNTLLNLFLSTALMSLDIAKLIDLALPMIFILIAQLLVMMLWAYIIAFNATGRDYDTAVMAAGHRSDAKRRRQYVCHYRKKRSRTDRMVCVAGDYDHLYQPVQSGDYYILYQLSSKTI